MTDPLTRSFRAMASPVTLRVVEPRPGAGDALDRAEAVVRDVGRTCSRFDPASALSRVNARPDDWHDVPETLAGAVVEAVRAHQETGGLFDPRVLDSLLAWGYDRTLPFADRRSDDGPDLPVVGTRARPRQPRPRQPWAPGVRREGARWFVRLDGLPIDLGGIGKGLAVRWAAAELAGAGRGWLVDAGGDGAVGGSAPRGSGRPSGLWHIAVEDPAGGADPVLVVETTDIGYATSSTRLRRWRAGGAPVHHLVDPRTGQPGGAGLASVTVLGPDPAWAEVQSKSVFLAGAEDVRERAEALGLAAAWVEEGGAIRTTPAMDARVIWRRAA